MQTMRDSWTDERLDEFGKRMDERFDRVDERLKEVDAKFAPMGKRFDAVEAQMSQEFQRVDKRLDRLGDGLESVQRAIVFGSIATSTSFVAGFVALAIKI
jgi:hypothetical protein